MEHAFLTNREIREYLKHFRESDWTKAAKYTLIYGILTLKEHYPLQTLTIENLEDILKKAQTVQCIEANIPELQKALEDIQLKLANINQHFPHSDPPNPSPKTTIEAQKKVETISPSTRSTNQQKSPYKTPSTTKNQAQVLQRPKSQPTVHKKTSPFPKQLHLKPKSDWRFGDQHPAIQKPKPAVEASKALFSFVSKPPVRVNHHHHGQQQGAVGVNHEKDGKEHLFNIYPYWWPQSESEQEEPEPQVEEEEQKRTPTNIYRSPNRRRNSSDPQIAYSKKEEDEGPAVYEDDLVTDAYLRVPSSGYGKKATDKQVQVQVQRQYESDSESEKAQKIAKVQTRNNKWTKPASKSKAEKAKHSPPTRQRKPVSKMSQVSVPNFKHVQSKIKDEIARDKKKALERAKNRGVEPNVHIKHPKDTPSSNRTSRSQGAEALRVASKFIGGPVMSHFQNLPQRKVLVEPFWKELSPLAEDTSSVETGDLSPSDTNQQPGNPVRALNQNWIGDFGVPHARVIPHRQQSGRKIEGSADVDIEDLELKLLEEKMNAAEEELKATRSTLERIQQQSRLSIHKLASPIDTRGQDFDDIPSSEVSPEMKYVEVQHSPIIPNPQLSPNEDDRDECDDESDGDVDETVLDNDEEQDAVTTSRDISVSVHIDDDNLPALSEGLDQFKGQSLELTKKIRRLEAEKEMLQKQFEAEQAALRNFMNARIPPVDFQALEYSSNTSNTSPETRKASLLPSVGNTNQDSEESDEV